MFREHLVRAREIPVELADQHLIIQQVAVVEQPAQAVMELDLLAVRAVQELQITLQALLHTMVVEAVEVL